MSRYLKMFLRFMVVIGLAVGITMVSASITNLYFDVCKVVYGGGGGNEWLDFISFFPKSGTIAMYVILIVGYYLYEKKIAEEERQ